MIETYPRFQEANPWLNDIDQLRNVMRQEGYLFFRGVVPREKVMELRRDVLAFCRDAGWLAPGTQLEDGIWSGIGPYTEGEPQYMELYKKMLHLPSFLSLPEDAEVNGIMAKILDAPPLLHRRRIGRITFPKNEAQSTGAHQDFHYIRGTPDTYTVWTPIGDCPVDLGGLTILKQSNHVGYIQHQQFNVKKYASKGLTDDQLPKGPGIEWVAGDFLMGDMIVFHSHTIHRALPNITPDRLRISVDNRYQRQDEQIEPGSMGTHYNF